jgi:hypothetical protein
MLKDGGKGVLRRKTTLNVAYIHKIFGMVSDLTSQGPSLEAIVSQSTLLKHAT